MNISKCRTTLPLLIVCLLLLVTTASMTYAQSVAQFTPTDCPEQFDQLPLQLACGLVAVPLEHDAPQRGTISVAVFRARSTGNNAAADPLVLLQGGPGGSVDTLLLASAVSLTDILAERDLVFIEQRGNRYSVPSLTCPSFVEKYLMSLADASTADQLALEASQSCLDEFAAAGIDLSAFDSVENARDIPTVVIDALGYSSYNLYGVSYGSQLAQHVMEIAPRGLRSVILDAVAPRGQDFDQMAPEYGWRAFKRLAEACAADTTCADANPDIEGALLGLLERLNAEPVNVTTINPTTGEEINVQLDDAALATVVFNSLYDTAGLANLPGLITAAAERDDFSWAAQTLVVLVSPDFSIGMNFAVNCSEQSYDDSQPIVSPDVPKIFVEAMSEKSLENKTLCPIVKVPLIASEANTPADADIPTLLMSGTYDPITPAEYGIRVAETLPKAVHVEFPGVGHGAIMSNTCPASIAAAFLKDPAAELDLSCVKSMGLRFAVSFKLSERTVGTATFLVPNDWTEIERGAFADATMGSFMLVQEEQGRVLEQLLNAMFEGANEQQLGTPAQRMLGQYTWTIYTLRLDSESMVIFAAGAETNANTYLVLLQGDINNAQQLEDDLLVPTLTAFRGK